MYAARRNTELEYQKINGSYAKQDTGLVYRQISIQIITSDYTAFCTWSCIRWVVLYQRGCWQTLGTQSKALQIAYDCADTNTYELEKRAAGDPIFHIFLFICCHYPETPMRFVVCDLLALFQA